MTNCASLFTLECTSVQITWPPALEQDNTFSLTIIHKRGGGGGGGENNVLLQKLSSYRVLILRANLCCKLTKDDKNYRSKIVL